jgi:hypothetical protein
VTGSTITHNDASVRGGGVGSKGNPEYAHPVIRNSIVSDNTSGDAGPDISAYSATMDVGFSLIGSPDPDTTINTTGPNLIGADPQLTSLAEFGGPTETQKPAATSPVIDAGKAFGLSSDQRGLARPFDAPTLANVGDATDIGAVELQAGEVPPAPTVPAAPPATPGTKKKCKKHKKKHKSSAESAKKCKKKKKKKH